MNNVEDIRYHMIKKEEDGETFYWMFTVNDWTTTFKQSCLTHDHAKAVLFHNEMISGENIDDRTAVLKSFKLFPDCIINE